MHFSDIISMERIRCAVPAASKKRALEELSQLIATADTSINPNEVFESLITREKLGSTGLGHGIAIPHGRLKASDHTVAAFIQLENGVDYDAPDNKPVDLLCALLVPPESTEEHLQILAELSEMFRSETLRNDLRQAKSAEEIIARLAPGK
ncbi:MAG: PTS IIA-like nitrogen regulatory protein PtsN [Gammaproteobacteria bacterium]|nr:PTS IIA-like nitrogen regulatory protein PtsN [Gammaproteobacteria bacterium]MDH5692597.1 PTS IIA-like nitrogen regulatory protein PtsN [Gammaproteobacteria bacterium]